MKKLNVGLVGCGNISDIYFTRCAAMEVLQVTACADILMDKAKAQGEKHSIPNVCTVEELLTSDDVDIVLNLTIPAVHGEIALAAIDAGKHVYNEKPLAVTREDGRAILDRAAAKNLRVGCAPDTFLGGGLQTCRKLIDDGAIGRPVAAAGFMFCPGHEGWHPSPEFFYKPGGGPMFDMGPYYLTAMTTLIGPVRSIAGSTAKAQDVRTITSQPLSGTKVTVEIPTHVTGILNFANGAVATLVTSFDVWHHNMPCLEIYGTEGSLSVPDPNCFGGPVKLRRAREEAWAEVPLTHGYADNSRGVGLADMASAILTNRPHRASGALAWHVLDIMHAFHDASDQGRTIPLDSGVERPAPMPADLKDGQID